MEIFVFGSNLMGIHGAGAAKHAAKHYGAKPGHGAGRTGNAYAIPTKRHPYETLPLDQINTFVKQFILYAKEHPELDFLVTPIGTGLAGYKLEDIEPMFQDAPPNCKKIWKHENSTNNS